MKKWIKYGILGVVGVFLGVFIGLWYVNNQNVTEETVSLDETTVHVESPAFTGENARGRLTTVDRVQSLDGEPPIDKGIVYTKLDESEKLGLYSEIDIYKSHSEGDAKEPKEYGLVEINTLDDWFAVFGSGNTESKPGILYFGFNECKYCKAFSPKIAKLGIELDVPIYYFNVRKNANSPIMTLNAVLFDFEYVPFVKAVNVVGMEDLSLDSNSSMVEIEQFLTKFKDLTK